MKNLKSNAIAKFFLNNLNQKRVKKMSKWPKTSIHPCWLQCLSMLTQTTKSSRNDLTKKEQFVSECWALVVFVSTPWTSLCVLSVCVRVKYFLRDSVLLKTQIRQFWCPENSIRFVFPTRILDLILALSKTEERHSDWLAHQNTKIKQKVIIVYLSWFFIEIVCMYDFHFLESGFLLSTHQSRSS